MSTNKLSPVAQLGLLVLATFVGSTVLGFWVMSLTLVVRFSANFLENLPRILLIGGSFLLCFVVEEIFGRVFGFSLYKGQKIFKIETFQLHDRLKSCGLAFLLWLFFAAGCITGIILYVYFTKDILHLSPN